jgi:iron complex outermembrane receptor protein
MQTLPPSLRKSACSLHVSAALALLLPSAFALAAENPTDAPVSLNAVTVTGQAFVPESTESAPSQNSLSARSAQSSVSDSFIRNFTSPVADYTQVVAMTPGAFSYSPNGVGLGDAKITMRGLADSNMVISFDGIPFNDTNGVSHHSWVFFPSQFLGGAVVDRSPGSAATIGQATFAGSIDLRSRVLDSAQRTSVELNAGSWNTRQLGVEVATGQFGEGGKSNLLFNIQDMASDGYQTFNDQNRKSTSLKYQYDAGGTVYTLFASYLNNRNHTPNIKGTSRANYDVGNYTYLLSGDPTQPNYFGFNFYDITTDFVYGGVSTSLGGGWKLEDKVYTYRYWNKQNYNNSATTINATSAIDKLNSYTTFGNLLRATNESTTGTLRLGLWLDRADSRRYQIPSDPRTWVDTPAPNFIETYVTTTAQPYIEYEFKITDDLRVTPGVKYASYKQDFVHYQDNGGAVGPLGGTFNKTTQSITGGAPTLSNAITYTDTMPSLDVHYRIQPEWSVYGQYAIGDQIPSTSVFDVKNAQVSPVPKATKSTTFQVGTVWATKLMTIGADLYHTKLDGAYTALPPDAAGNVGYVLSGTEVAQGLEAEANFVLGGGWSLYANATFASLKYDNGKWVAGAPKDTQALGVNYQSGEWAVNFSANRVGEMYNDAKDGTHEAFTIDPVTVANLFVNYTVKKPMSFAKQLKLQFGVNNLFDSHNIVGIASPVAGSSSAKPLAADLLTILPGRSVSLTATLDF